MDINITTKYNIGDTVYTAQCYYGDFFPSKACTITDIRVMALGVNNPPTIIYDIINDGIEDVINEPSCFDTYAECSKWCTKQNGTSYTLSIDKTE